MKEEQLGLINEVGDLGLGFDPITESEEEKLNKNKEKEDEK